MGISKNSAYPSLLVEGAGVEVMRARVFRDALNKVWANSSIPLQFDSFLLDCPAP